MFGFRRNQRSVSVGIGVRIGSESVFGFDRNAHVVMAGFLMARFFRTGGPEMLRMMNEPKEIA